MKKKRCIKYINTAILLVLISILNPLSFAQSTNSILIQAEDFTSYVDDSEGNYDLVYRQDVDVDMNYDHDPYMYEGIRVMAIRTGEKLTYTFDVPVTDVWDITFNGHINFDLHIDGSFYASGIGTAIDLRGDFRVNYDNLVPGVALSAGTHTMTIISNSQNDFGDVQLDYIHFASTTDPPGPPPVAPKPYDDTAPPAAPQNYVSPVSRYGQLYVDGPNIKSSITGETPQLRFLAISSSKWFPTIKNNTIYNMAYHEHIDGIRLAMYAEYLTYDDPYLRPYLREKTLEVINECIDAGIYLEISYHTHATDFEINGTAYEVENNFYDWLLAQPVVTAQPPNLIFGVINEIADSTITWETAKPYAQVFVDLIRQTHPDNIILCGTPFWCQNPQDVIGNELTGNNIVYTFHLYTAQHDINIADNVITCYNAGIPIWANEISPGHYDWKVWSYNFNNFNNLIDILETRGIPWTNWAWTIKGEALSALYWHTQYYGPWTDSELTEGGQFIRSLLRNIPDAVLGDVDGDQSITIIDALLVAQYYVGLNPSTFNVSVADVDASNSIDIVDALLIAQFYVGLITEFPGQNPTPGPNTGKWGTYVDTYGSTVDPPEGTDALVDGVASASFVIVGEPTPEGEYPFAGLFYEPDPTGAMVTIDLPVTFTYKSTGNIRFTIGQEVIKDNGEAWGYNLPAVNDWTEITLDESDLAQPDWVSSPTPLNLSAVYQLKWEPKMGAAGGSALIDVTDLLLEVE